VSYRSTVDGVCHACGHDVHTAVLLGAALALVDGGGPPRGVVRLVFQPAEELIPGGALDVIATGAIDDVDVMVALHCAPTLDAGLVGLRDGVITAASDAVEIRLTGPGGHTARPELTVDLVAALAKLAVGLPPALASHGAPDRPLALVWGAINAGAAGNVIPASGALRGSVRTMDGRLWDQAEGLLRQAVDATLAGTGARAEVDYRRGVPPVVNDPAVVDLFRAGVVEMVGPLAVAATEPSMGGEDFGWYLQRVPGALARLGVRRPGEAAGDLHRAGFDVDEAAIAVGVRTLVGTALAALTPTLTGTGREPGISPPS
jgi:amidohydrolase